MMESDIVDPKPDLEIDGVPFPFESSTPLYLPQWNVASPVNTSEDVKAAFAQDCRSRMNRSCHARMSKQYHRDVL